MNPNVEWVVKTGQRLWKEMEGKKPSIDGFLGEMPPGWVRRPGEEKDAAGNVVHRVMPGSAAFYHEGRKIVLVLSVFASEHRLHGSLSNPERQLEVADGDVILREFFPGREWQHLGEGGFFRFGASKTRVIHFSSPLLPEELPEVSGLAEPSRLELPLGEDPIGMMRKLVSLLPMAPWKVDFYLGEIPEDGDWARVVAAEVGKTLEEVERSPAMSFLGAVESLPPSLVAILASLKKAVGMPQVFRVGETAHMVGKTPAGRAIGMTLTRVEEGELVREKVRSFLSKLGPGPG